MSAAQLKTYLLQSMPRQANLQPWLLAMVLVLNSPQTIMHSHNMQSHVHKPAVWSIAWAP